MQNRDFKFEPKTYVRKMFSPTISALSVIYTKFYERRKCTHESSIMDMNFLSSFTYFSTSIIGITTNKKNSNLKYYLAQH